MHIDMQSVLHAVQTSISAELWFLGSHAMLPTHVAACFWRHAVAQQLSHLQTQQAAANFSQLQHVSCLMLQHGSPLNYIISQLNGHAIACFWQHGSPLLCAFDNRLL